MLDVGDMTIIPLAKGRQTNPIYSRPPGQGGEMLAKNCSIAVIAKRFTIGQIGNMLFVAAEIDMPEFAMQGWINMWQGYAVQPERATRSVAFPLSLCELPGTGEAPDLISDEECPWSGPLTGTLFCALDGWMVAESLCLCGSCMHSWGIQGWICEDLWRHGFGMGIEF